MSKPTHYQATPEAIDVIEGHDLNFNRGNCVKYVLRAGKKGTSLDAILDMEKAAWYATREADRLRKVAGIDAKKIDLDPYVTLWGKVEHA